MGTSFCLKSWLNRDRILRAKNRLVNTYFTVARANSLPSNFDWRSKGVLTPVKDQVKNGPCWVFASVSCIEALNKIATGKLIRLSVQQILDNVLIHPCGGGHSTYAFQHCLIHGGLASEKAYPSTKHNGVYRWEATYDLSSKEDELDHEVLVVGYGTYKNGKDYWVIQNSQGRNWGHNGFVLVPRNKKIRRGECSLARRAFYPTMVGAKAPFVTMKQPLIEYSPCYCEVCRWLEQRHHSKQ
ncbi:hypothetical protein SSX86_028157 [Deinandra increscens subsp. villosa]|uniref:Peptidase C1A papain C-terminal domain-containing protein n=1 Tax=Deinandra increscens subsp. villosa TaxID=3103831 RepID=A0AAP0CCM0_9ASTR